MKVNFTSCHNPYKLYKDLPINAIYFALEANAVISVACVNQGCYNANLFFEVFYKRSNMTIRRKISQPRVN